MAEQGPPALGEALRQADESLDRLSRTLWILQKIRGHRATTDDVLLAAFALDCAPEARSLLDLGTGKGTVALLLCGARPELRAVGIEAEPESVDLARRNARLNGLEQVYAPRLGDLRAPEALADAGSFDLICGAPPFMPLGSGVLPRNALRAAGRFELRGGVAAYAEAAARHLGPSGQVVLLMDGHGRDRLIAAFARARLRLRRLCAVGPRPGTPPTYWVGVGQLSAPAETEDSNPGGARCALERLDLRPPAGVAWSKPYAEHRQRLQLP